VPSSAENGVPRTVPRVPPLTRERDAYQHGHRAERGAPPPPTRAGAIQDSAATFSGTREGAEALTRAPAAPSMTVHAAVTPPSPAGLLGSTSLDRCSDGCGGRPEVVEGLDDRLVVGGQSDQSDGAEHLVVGGDHPGLLLVRPVLLGEVVMPEVGVLGHEIRALARCRRRSRDEASRLMPVLVQRTHAPRR